MPGHLRHRSEYDDDFYWKRVARNLGWLGNTEAEQRERQCRLRDTVIGVAGCGGIGGATAERLVRMGVRHLKLADPDTFEASNINRQFGASVTNIGRNKAEAVADLVYDVTRDVNIEVYPEGITKETADEFIDGCDYVLDKIELYEIDARYALHQAFRRSSRCQFMLLTPVFGNRTFFFKWTRDSMTVLDRWFIDDLTCPIFAGTPPLAQGMLASRLGQAITGLDQLPGAKELPVTPGYSMIDTQLWIMKTVEGKWW